MFIRTNLVLFIQLCSTKVDMANGHIENSEQLHNLQS